MKRTIAFTRAAFSSVIRKCRRHFDTPLLAVLRSVSRNLRDAQGIAEARGTKLVYKNILLNIVAQPEALPCELCGHPAASTGIRGLYRCGWRDLFVAVSLKTAEHPYRVTELTRFEKCYALYLMRKAHRMSRRDVRRKDEEHIQKLIH